MAKAYSIREVARLCTKTPDFGGFAGPTAVRPRLGAAAPTFRNRINVQSPGGVQARGTKGDERR